MPENLPKKQSDILIYQTENGETRIDVRLENETVWLTQAHMAELFGKGRSTITEHIGNIFKEGELDEKLVCRDFRHTTQHGAINGKTQSKGVKHYNLDVIISVGYRVKSRQGTQFRIWATKTLKEYIVKGFALNDERFKTGKSMNYFNELQERLPESIMTIRQVVARYYLRQEPSAVVPHAWDLYGGCWVTGIPQRYFLSEE